MIDRFYQDITVKRVNPVSIGTYGNMQSGEPIIELIEGFIEVASYTQILTGNTHQIKVTDVLYCKIGSNVKYGDLVVFENSNYRLVSHPENVSGRNHHLEVLLERLDTDV